MTVSSSPRLGLTRWSADTDSPTRTQFDGDNADLDELVAIDRQGIASARPAAGVRGTFYTVTDGPDAGTTFRDDGTTWRRVNRLLVRESIPLSVHGDVTAGVRVQGHYFASVPPGQTVTLTGLVAFAGSPGGVLFDVVRNGSVIPGWDDLDIPAGTTVILDPPDVTLATGDLLAGRVQNITTGTPNSLYVALLVDRLLT